MKNLFRLASLALFAAVLTANVFGSTFNHSISSTDRSTVVVHEDENPDGDGF